MDYIVYMIYGSTLLNTQINTLPTNDRIQNNKNKSATMDCLYSQIGLD